MGLSYEELKLLGKDNSQFLEDNPELAELIVPKTPKHRNKQTTEPDGEHYGSGAEAATARGFIQGVANGDYVLYKHNVRVKLPSGNVMVIDHFYVDNKLQSHWGDTKAWDIKTQKYLVTRAWKNKAKEFKAAFGIEIELL